jgi:branched-chain amino acid aminotransferase
VSVPKYAFFEGRIVPYTEARVGVLTHALNYGTGAFAGIRAYWNPEQQELYVFRPMDHFRRLLNSAKLLASTVPYTPEQLTGFVVELLRKEGYREDVYIRPLIYKADEVIGVRLHDIRTELSICSIPFQRYMRDDEDAHVTVSSWRRVDDNAIPARGKICGTSTRRSSRRTRPWPDSMRCWCSRRTATSRKAAP